MKKLLSILLTAAVLLTLFAAVPFSVSADDADLSAEGDSAPTSGTTGECKWRRDKDTLYIYGSGRMKDYHIMDPAPWGRLVFTKAVIEDGVTYVGKYSFDSMNYLQSVTLGKTVAEVGEGAFENCRSLESLTLNSNIFFWGGAFDDSYLKKVNISSLDQWLDCYFHTNTSSIEGTSNPLFYGAELYLNGKLLTDITIDKEWIFDFAFIGCSSIKSVTFTDKVKGIGSKAFYRSAITNVKFGSGVTEIGPYAFSSTFLSELELPDSLTTIGYCAFRYTGALKSVTIPPTVTEIGSEAFGAANDFTIYGYANTEAQRYAADHLLNFVILKNRLMLGDADGDGSVTIVDATAIQRTIAELTTKAFVADAADVDRDGTVTIMDATAIQRYIAELSTAAVGIGKAIGK